MTPRLTRRRLLETCAALGGLVMLHPFSARAQAGQAHLRILATTDLHCHVQPYDYYADKPTDTLGLAVSTRLWPPSEALVLRLAIRRY